MNLHAGWDWVRAKVERWKGREEIWSAEDRGGRPAHAICTEKGARALVWLAQKSRIAIRMNDSQRDLEPI